jgi:hypothetical protein
MRGHHDAATEGLGHAEQVSCFDVESIAVVSAAAAETPTAAVHRRDAQAVWEQSSDEGPRSRVLDAAVHERQRIPGTALVPADLCPVGRGRLHEGSLSPRTGEPQGRVSPLVCWSRQPAGTRCAYREHRSGGQMPACNRPATTGAGPTAGWRRTLCAGLARSRFTPGRSGDKPAMRGSADGACRGRRLPSSFTDAREDRGMKRRSLPVAVRSTAAIETVISRCASPRWDNAVLISSSTGPGSKGPRARTVIVVPWESGEPDTGSRPVHGRVGAGTRAGGPGYRIRSRTGRPASPHLRDAAGCGAAGTVVEEWRWSVSSYRISGRRGCRGWLDRPCPALHLGELAGRRHRPA